MFSFCLRGAVYCILALSSTTLIQALPQQTSSTSSISTTSLAAPSSTTTASVPINEKTRCQSSRNTTIPHISLTILSDRANDFCSQLAGEGMFSSKIVLYQEPYMEVSFARSNWDDVSHGEACAKMDGDECLKGLAELGGGCAKRADGSGDIVLQGFLTHRTSCGTYSVKTSQEGAQTGGAVDNVGRSESVKLVANDACSRAISGGLMLWVMLAVSVGVML